MEKILFSNTMGSEGREKELNKLARIANESGLLTMVSSGGSIALTTEYQKINVGGEVAIDETKNMYEYNQTLQRLEVKQSGYYSIRLCGSVEFPGSVELELSCFINGVEYSPDAHPQQAGRGGGKPTMINVITTIPLIAGDYMEMMAKVDSATTLTMNGNNLSIEKKVF